MLKELKSQHRTIIQMAFSGFKNQEIAERLDMAQSTISSILRSPLGQAYMGGLHDKSKESTLDVRKQLVSMNTSALAAFERILCPAGKAPYNVQFSTAKDILDRNGFKPTDKINIDMTLQSKSDQEIDAEIAALQNSITKAATANGQEQEQQETALATDTEPEDEAEAEPETDLNADNSADFNAAELVDYFPPK
jgi:ribosomal protein L12E/L44/L45/RPP1/RPP2